MREAATFYRPRQTVYDQTCVAYCTSVHMVTRYTQDLAVCPRSSLYCIVATQSHTQLSPPIGVSDLDQSQVYKAYQIGIARCHLTRRVGHVVGL